MATRFYWGQVITDPAIAFSATWSAPGSTPTRLMMRTVKRKATVTPIVASASETTASVLNKQAVQLISMPLAAQTITGTVKGYALFSESDTAQDCRVQCEIRVISRTGTVRGTLLASDTGALSSEFTTTPTNRRIPLLAATNTLTSVDAQEGDLLVVEIGHRTHVASATSYTVTVQWNDDPSSTDLPEDETDTDTTKAPWIEFSQTLVLTDYFDDNTVVDFPSGGNSAEPKKPSIPDVASKVSYDILADLSTPAIDEDVVLEATAATATVPGTTPNLAFEDNTLTAFKSSSNSAEPKKPSIPDVASKVSYDILANLNTPAIDEDLAEEALAAITTVPGTTPSLAFNDNTLIAFKSSNNSAEPKKPSIPDLAPKDRRYDILASLGTPALDKDLVEESTAAATTYVNRVYDSVASKFVRWITSAPDTTGTAYPGPGTFGVHTSNYVIEIAFA